MAIERVGVQPIVVEAGPAMIRHTYQVTELSETGESEPSIQVACENDLSVEGNVNYLHWKGGAGSFRVYRAAGGPIEQIAEVSTQSFIDDGSISRTA